MNFNCLFPYFNSSYTLAGLCSSTLFIYDFSKCSQVSSQRLCWRVPTWRSSCLRLEKSHWCWWEFKRN